MFDDDTGSVDSEQSRPDGGNGELFSKPMSRFRFLHFALTLCLMLALVPVGAVVAPSGAEAAVAKKTVSITLKAGAKQVQSGQKVTFTGTVKYKNKKPAKKISVRFQTRTVGTSRWYNNVRVRTNSRGAFRASINIVKNTQVRVWVGNKSIKIRYSKTIAVGARQKVWVTSIPKDVEHRSVFTVTGRTTPGLRGMTLQFSTPWTETESDDVLGSAKVSKSGTFSARIRPGTFQRANKALNIWYRSQPGVPIQKFDGIARFNVWDWYPAVYEVLFGLTPAPFQTGTSYIDGKSYRLSVSLSGTDATSGSFHLGARLGQGCDKVRFTVGVDDYSTDRNVTWSASIKADGSTIWSKGPLTLGTATPVTLNLSRSTVRTVVHVNIADAKGIARPDSTIVLGDLKLHCLWNNNL